MQLNGHKLIDRYNRPSVNSQVAIRAQFLNNGVYIDPYDVSACTIFHKLANASPSSVLDPATQIIKTGLAKTPESALGILMNFQISGHPGDEDSGGHDGAEGRVTSNYLNNNTWFPAYTPQNSASGIYRVSAGDYVAVLDGSRDLSGGFNLNYPFQDGVEVVNGTSAVAEYIDIWTVKLYENSEYQTFINNFTLYNDTFITLTEPLLLTTSNRLHTKHLNVGASATRQDLMITTAITVNNRNLTEDVKNIIQDYGLRNPAISINRVVDGTAVPTSVKFTTDNALIRVTGDNTIIYPFIDSGDGVTPGSYVVEVYYDFLNQRIKSQPMYFVVS